MPFSEKIKLEAKKKACFRCVICQKPFVEIHHIVPQANGGSNTIDNAAPLCASCHDLYGGNPEKRKQIREMRDHWFDLMERRFNGEINILEPITENPNNINMLKNKGIVLYHVVYDHEGFEITATILVKLLQNTQRQFANQKRYLFLDIEGHRNDLGGYDYDMFELQKDFALGFLMQYFTKIHMPLIGIKNNKFQRNDVPQEFEIYSDEKEMIKKLKKESIHKHFEVYPLEAD